MMKEINPKDVFTRYLGCEKRIRRCVKPCEKCKYAWSNSELAEAMKMVINQGENNDTNRGEK